MLTRWLIIIAAALAVPVIPFLLFHGPIEAWLGRLAEHPPSPPVIVMLVVGLLGTDVLLPIPSSFVSTLAGGHLAPWVATLASWTGLNLGAAVGYTLGSRWGRPCAVRLAGEDDLRRVQQWGETYAPAVLVFTRALPILAEAAVLLFGVQRIPWRRFWPPVLLSNLGIAAAYSLLGRYAADQEWLPIALSISVALPLLLTFWIRRVVRSDLRPDR